MCPHIVVIMAEVENIYAKHARGETFSRQACKICGGTGTCSCRGNAGEICPTCGATRPEGRACPMCGQPPKKKAGRPKKEGEWFDRPCGGMELVPRPAIRALIVCLMPIIMLGISIASLAVCLGLSRMWVNLGLGVIIVPLFGILVGYVVGDTPD